MNTNGKPGASRLGGPRLYLGLLAALLAFHGLANLCWLAADNHTIRVDEEGHMLMARNYYEALFPEDPANLFERLIATGKIKLGIPAHPPLLHILGAFFVRGAGYSVDRLAALNTLMFLLALLGLWCVARRLLKPPEALFAVLVASFTPLLFVGSRYFMTDYLSMTLTVWAIYALLRSDSFRNTPWVFSFAVLNGLGILARTPNFLYVLVPAALAFLCGLGIALRQSDRPALARLAFHAILTVVVSAGIFSPWYYHHLDRYYTYWTKDHQVGIGGAKPRQAAAEKTEDGKPETASKPSRFRFAQVLSVSIPKPASEEKAAQPGLPRLLKRLLQPRVAWSRYPTYVINNALFLPLFLLSLAGMVIALTLARFRSPDLLLLLGWILGSWVLMTLLFRFATVRYSLQVVPALSLFAALPVLSIPWPRPRRAAMGLLTIGLLFQYGNLTVHAYGPIARAHIPASVLPYRSVHLGDPGYVLYKDTLSMAFSYSGLGAPAQNNYKDKLILAMADQEVARQDTLSGDYANYVQVNVRGMDFDEKHFWPAPNPYLRKDLPPERIPPRRLHTIGKGKNPQAVTAKLPNADYVVYGVDGAVEDTENAWRGFFEQRGFQLTERFDMPAFGVVPKRTYGVMARKDLGKTVRINTAEDIDAMALFDLYRTRRTPNFRSLPRELQDYARDRLKSEIESKSTPFPVNDHLTFMTLTLQPDGEGWYLFRLVFRVDKTLEKKYQMYFHGLLPPEQQHLLPEHFREAGRHYWNFVPEPPTTSWQEGEYVFVTHRIQARPITYRIIFGLSDMSGKFFGKTVDVGHIDLGALAGRGD